MLLPVSDPVSISETSPTTFTCVVSGLPLPSITWFFRTSGSDQQLMSTDTLVINASPMSNQELTSELVFKVVNRSNTGEYTCSSMNILGAINVTKTLDVLCKEFSL